MESEPIRGNPRSPPSERDGEAHKQRGQPPWAYVDALPRLFEVHLTLGLRSEVSLRFSRYPRAAPSDAPPTDPATMMLPTSPTPLIIGTENRRKSPAESPTLNPTAPATASPNIVLQSPKATPSDAPTTAPAIAAIGTSEWLMKEPRVSPAMTPTVSPGAPSTARITTRLQSFKASPSDAPPTAPAMRSVSGNATIPGSNKESGRVIAPPIPNPTAPKMTSLITLVALMVSCLSIPSPHPRGLHRLSSCCSKDGKAHQRPWYSGK